ncbi:MAG: glyoxalase [candidate division Zixibacteria bacterium]|nr:glyoxalase [candidate division Zixibacteria bacterium]
MSQALFILYVADQERSTTFYSAALGLQPILNVPGMTEFALNDGSSLGLMPAAGIKRLLGENLPDPMPGDGIPRCELYLTVDDPTVCLDRAIAVGAKEVSPAKTRDWGDTVAYCLDPDGHVLAFARRLQ